MSVHSEERRKIREEETGGSTAWIVTASKPFPLLSGIRICRGRKEEMSSSSREVMHTPGWTGKTHRDRSVGAAIPELAVISPAGVSSWEF